ncbi:MAG: SusC/RagA family TonB-linked outer membrane protein, partial [Alistipes sp.]
MRWATNWLNNFKIRASAGTLGNGSVAPYSFLSTMTLSQSSILVDGHKVMQTLAPLPIPSGLTWEKATTYDIGLDVDLLNNRLNFVGDYYWRYTTDMYTVGKTLPAVFGNLPPKGNYADMKTTGWEVSLGWRDSFRLGDRDFHYGIRAMVWDSRSYITRFNNTTKKLTDYYDGMEVGEIWGLQVAGLFQDDEEVKSWANQSDFFVVNRNGNQFQAGDLKFSDLDGSGAIDYGKNTVDNPGDMRKIGNSTPRYSYGLTLNASYAGVGISLFFQGVGKRDWYPSTNSAYFWGNYNRPYSYMPEKHTGNNIWTPQNQNSEAFWPRMTGYISTDKKGVFGKVANDRFLVDASYCRLKNITIDYNFS